LALLPEAVPLPLRWRDAESREAQPVGACPPTGSRRDRTARPRHQVVGASGAAATDGARVALESARAVRQTSSVCRPPDRSVDPLAWCSWEAWGDALKKREGGLGPAKLMSSRGERERWTRRVPGPVPNEAPPRTDEFYDHEIGRVSGQAKGPGGRRGGVLPLASRPAVCILGAHGPDEQGVRGGDRRVRGRARAAADPLRERPTEGRRDGRPVHRRRGHPLRRQGFTEAMRQVGVYWLLLNEPPAPSA